MYVAGLERGDRPIGDWSISMTFSSCSMPSITLCLPALIFARFSLCASVLYKISLINVDLPDPDTPVTAINCPSGMSTLTFFKLFSCAPLMVSLRPS